MKHNFDPKSISQAARVSEFLYELCQKYPERYNAVKIGIPFGDLAYGTALMDWYKNGCPKRACFSYADGQVECPVLMEFRKEISEKFGLPILTKEEATKFDNEAKNIITKKVHDWGLN